MRTIIAIVAGFVIFFILLATLRGFVGQRSRGKPIELEAVEPMPEGLRILYWCETCGLEVLVERRGGEAAPRHCGEAMTRREEIVGGE